MVDPQPTLVELLVRHVLLPRELLPQIEINSFIADLGTNLGRRFVSIPTHALVSHDTVLLHRQWCPARDTPSFRASYGLLPSSVRAKSIPREGEMEGTGADVVSRLQGCALRSTLSMYAREHSVSVSRSNNARGTCIMSTYGSCTPWKACSRQPSTNIVAMQGVAELPLPASIPWIPLPFLAHPSLICMAETRWRPIIGTNIAYVYMC